MKTMNAINIQYGVRLEEAASSLTQGCDSGPYMESGTSYRYC